MQPVPLGAELVDPVALGVALLRVAGVQVERMAVEDDLSGAVVALQGGEHRGRNAGAGLRRPLGRDRRPCLGAGAVAVGLVALVLLEQVHGPPLGVDEDLAELGVAGDVHGGRATTACGAAAPAVGGRAGSAPGSRGRAVRRGRAAASAAAGERDQRNQAERRGDQREACSRHVSSFAWWTGAGSSPRGCRTWPVVRTFGGGVSNRDARAWSCLDVGGALTCSSPAPRELSGSA